MPVVRTLYSKTVAIYPNIIHVGLNNMFLDIETGYRKYRRERYFLQPVVGPVVGP